MRKVLLLLVCAAAARAQDPFEIQVFEYEPLLELRGSVEKHIGRLQMDGNIVFARALHGPSTRAGWSLEPAARIGWKASPKITPSLEYYSGLGPIGSFLPGPQQIHLLVPGADWQVNPHVKWSLGVGVGATDSGNHVVLKSRFEWDLGRTR